MNIRDLLIFSLDNPLSPEDEKRLNEALKSDSELRKEKDNLLKMRGMFSEFSVPENEGFADGILQKINAESNARNRDFETKFIRMFPRVAAACVIFLAMAFSAVNFSETRLVSDELIGIEDADLVEAYSYLDL